MTLKLNMGCGLNMLAGYVNVDMVHTKEMDVVAETLGCELMTLDLEKHFPGAPFMYPWPWDDNSVDEVVFNHSLEHMGRDPYDFIGIMCELYRVTKHHALIKINVPHPRHDFFLNDPTHVRPLMPETFEMFSKEKCHEWQRTGAANTPLALIHNVDFELIDVTPIPDPVFQQMVNKKRLKHDTEQLQWILHMSVNTVCEFHLVLRTIK